MYIYVYPCLYIAHQDIRSVDAAHRKKANLRVDGVRFRKVGP